MNLVEHARRELDLMGQTAEDPAYAQSIIAAVAAFASYGHSGGSAMCAAQQLHALIRYQPLSPLTTNPDEWMDRSAESGYPIWQNVRHSEAFSTDAGATHYLLGDPDTILTTQVHPQSKKVIQPTKSPPSNVERQPAEVRTESRKYRSPSKLTFAELEALGTTTDIVTAGRAFGMSRDHAYDLARSGQFPCTVVKVGSRYVVPTNALRNALGNDA